MVTFVYHYSNSFQTFAESVSHFFRELPELYWALANMGLDKSLENYVRIRRVCKGYEPLI